MKASGFEEPRRTVVPPEVDKTMPPKPLLHARNVVVGCWADRDSRRKRTVALPARSNLMALVGR